MLLPYKALKRAVQRSLQSFWSTQGRLVLRLNEANYGTDLSIAGPVKLDILGSLTIGNHCKIASGPSFNPVGGSTQTSITVRKGAKLSIADWVGLSNTEIYCWTEISIGERTLIGGGTRIYDSDFHPLAASQRNPDVATAIRSRPIKIGRNVFIGGGSIITKGVTIGDESVIGAGSVVTRDIPEGEVWAGNPARFLRKVPTPTPLGGTP